jgi:hypothetical protein
MNTTFDAICSPDTLIPHKSILVLSTGEIQRDVRGIRIVTTSYVLKNSFAVIPSILTKKWLTIGFCILKWAIGGECFRNTLKKLLR